MEIDRELLLRSFQEEAEEQLAALEQGLVALEASPGDAELLARLFRAAHTFKGNAACVGLAGLAAFAHAVEDALDRLRERRVGPSRELTGLLLGAIDGLRRAIPRAAEGVDEPHPAQAALSAWLARHADAGASQPSPAPGAAPASHGETARADPAHHTLRVQVEKLDRMLDLTGELAVARGRVAALFETPGVALAELREAHRDADRLFLSLQELVMQARLVAIGPTFQQHARTVRDVAAEQGKQARLSLQGEDVEVDTAVIQAIRDPLLHLVRNAVDHGIEAPAQRLARGKPPFGQITLKASHQGGKIAVEVADDGGGLDRARIAAKARAMGLLENPEAASDEELFALILEPGFSTAERVSELSGRGVGLDVVRRNVESLRGRVCIDTRPGEGTRFTLELPLTLAIIEGFSVGVGEETFVLPLDAVVECVELPAEERAHRRGRGVINLRGHPLPYLRLGHHFGLPPAPSARESVVVLRHEGGRAGVAVDALHGEGQTVIKPLSRLFQRVRGVSGSALMGDGRVALILDVPALLREVVEQAQGREPGASAA